jgi:hypothetical protein
VSEIVQPLLEDERTWVLLLEHAAPAVRIHIGVAAHAEGKERQAELAWRRPPKAATHAPCGI